MHSLVTNLKALPRSAWILFGGTFINRFGTFVMPFLPLYFEQLGVSEIGAIAMWSGVSLGITPAVTAIMAPMWARVGER